MGSLDSDEGGDPAVYPGQVPPHLQHSCAAPPARSADSHSPPHHALHQTDMYAMFDAARNGEYCSILLSLSILKKQLEKLMAAKAA